MPSSQDCVVCLGLPAFHEQRFVERLSALDGVAPVVLPIDPGGDWVSVSPAEPSPEPPPWAEGVAAERAEALARATIFVGLHVPEKLLTHAPNLKWVQSIGAGVEQFGKAGLGPSQPVVLTNASGTSSNSMAEWIIGRLLQVWKRFRECDDLQNNHAFERTYGRTFAGSTIGILGLGHIGEATAVRARALGCKVLGLKRSAKPGDTSEFADELFPTSGLSELLSRSDAVIVCAPDTPETHHMINAEALDTMKDDAVLVNVARGPLVDEAAVAEAMRAGKIGAAVLDVFDPEPLDAKSPLWDLPGVYISAHSSVSVDRYMDDVFDLFLDNLARYRSGEPLRNVVDMAGMGFD